MRSPVSIAFAFALTLLACSSAEPADTNDAATTQDASAMDGSGQNDGSQQGGDARIQDAAQLSDGAQSADGSSQRDASADASAADGNVSADGSTADGSVTNACKPRDPSATSCRAPGDTCQSLSLCCTCQEGDGCNQWVCADPTDNARACPTNAPKEGSRCQTSRTSCSYCTGAGPVQFFCSGDGAWTVDDFVFRCGPI